MKAVSPSEIRSACKEFCSYDIFECGRKLLSEYIATDEKDLFVEHHILDYLDIPAKPVFLDIAHDEIRKHC